MVKLKLRCGTSSMIMEASTRIRTRNLRKEVGVIESRGRFGKNLIATSICRAGAKPSTRFPRETRTADHSTNRITFRFHLHYCSLRKSVFSWYDGFRFVISFWLSQPSHILILRNQTSYNVWTANWNELETEIRSIIWDAKPMMRFAELGLGQIITVRCATRAVNCEPSLRSEESWVP